MEESITLLKAAAITEIKEKSPENLMAFAFPVENCNGFTFGVVIIKDQTPQADNLIKIIHTNFKTLATLIQEKTSVSYHFEKTLEIINQEIADQTEDLTPIFNPQKILALVGVAINSTMYLSGLGEITATFLHKLPDQRYRVFNLARSIQTEQTAVSWTKLFSVVLDGDLTPGDVLCVSNQSLPQEINPEDLHSLLASLPPQSAAVKIRQYFPLEINLGLLILKAEDLERNTSKVSAPSSLKQLHNSRENTKKILADQKPTFVGTLIAKAFSSIKNSRGSKYLFRLLGKILWAAALVALKIITGFFVGLLHFIRRLISSSERREVMRETQTNVDRGIKSVLGFLNRLPKTSRYLILAAAALVIVLVLGIFFASRAHENNQARQAFETAVEKVETLRDKASGAIIYKNETQAKTFLKEAQTLLTTIESKKPEDKEKITTLQSELDKISNSLRRDTEVTPEILASTSSLASPVTLSSLALINGELYSLGDDKVLYHVNKTNKNLETSTLSETVTSGQEVSVDETFAIWLDQKPGIDIYDATSNKLVATSATPSADQRWVDLYAYADRVYVLSPGSGLTSQIYRFSRIGSELGTATTWIKSPTDTLSDGISLAVDGTIFVLKQSGKIIRLVGGQEVSWTQSAIEPALTSASDIWTSADSLYLYVLDPAGQRLVVYEKENGNLKVQYHSASLTSLTDFAIDETNKTIYFLGNGSIYKITAEHLK